MTNVNSFYASYVTTFMTIDMNENGLYCEVPSESNGESYTVQVDESGVCPIVTSCQCLGFKYHGHCKHETVVNAYWNKMYASNIAKASDKALEQAMDLADEQEEMYTMAEISEGIASTVKSVDLPSEECHAPKVRKSGDKLVLTAQTCKIMISSKPRRKFATEYVAKQEHYGKVKSQMRDIRETSVLNGTPQKDEMPAWLAILPSRREKVGA